MIRYSEELACQRDLLIARCARQRNALSVQGQVLVEKLTTFDIGLSVFERLKKNPALVAGLVVSLVVIKPRRILLVLQTGLIAWQTLIALTPTVKNIMEYRAAK